MNDILNPYIAGAPVVESSMFFGREDVFSWIERSLAGRYVDHILVLHGQRRVGKTSVLKQIPNYLPDRYIQVFFDLQGRTNTPLDRFLWWLAREISRTLMQIGGIDLPRPDRENFAEDPEYLINDFLPGLKSFLEDKVLLLTFDEFDTLDRPDIQKSFAEPLIETLRRLMDIEGINFIFSIGSSGDKLENMQASYTDFFKSALYRKISFLTRYDCQRLITRPVEGIIKYDHEAVNQIYTITSGHPYFTQLMCHELFSLCQKTGKREILKGDVESILDDVVERGTVNLKFVWDEANDLEKWVLAGLAQLGGKATTLKLGEELKSQRIRFSEADLNSAVIHLQDKDVISQENRFIIRLMYMWLRVNRPLDRVREELVEINPIANRYIEIGDEYQDLGQTVEAIESYQQALTVDPGNHKARLSMGVIHLEMGAYLQAVEEFDLALKIDDEDIVSRSGLCDANLALGREANDSEQIDDAIRYFQKILVINPEHLDARGYLAGIYQEQAENLLSNRQDEEALSKFNRAVELTPDDQELEARYQEILAQKKAKVIDSWLREFERAKKDRRWDDAIEAIGEVLRISPDDQDLQAKVKAARESRHRFELETCKEKAEEASSMEDWGQAIQAWQEYITYNPKDRSGAEKELENARKYHQIAEDYAKAQDFMQKRRYDHAIELLQLIIAQDPTYKSASKLLAESVRSRIRAPILRRPISYIIMGLVVLVFAGIFFGPRIWPFISSALQQARTPDFVDTIQTYIGQTPPDNEKISVDVPTLSTIPTVDPQIIFQPILDTIADVPPDYEEDFLIPQEYWNDEANSIVIADFVSDGVLRLNDDPTVQTYYNFRLSPYDGEIRDFVLQFDFTPHQFGFGSQLYFDFRADGDVSGSYVFEIMRDGTWTFRKHLNEQGIELLNGETTYFNLDNMYQFRLMAKGNQMAVAIDEKYLFFLEDNSISEGLNFIGFYSYKPFEVDIDNIQVWYLDGVDLNDQENARFQESQPVGVLDYISEKAPTIEDKFSGYDKLAWISSPGLKFTNTRPGTMVMEVENAVDVLARGYFLRASDFVIQYDFRIEGSDSTSSIFDVRNDSISFEFNGGGEWLISKDDVIANGVPQNYFPDKWNSLIIFAQGDHFESYLNDELLHAFTETVSGEENVFHAACASGEFGSVIIDNLKFWNLDGLTMEQQISYAPESGTTNQQVTNISEPEITNLLYKKLVFTTAITSLDWSNNQDIGNLIAVAGRGDHAIIINGSTGQERRDPIMSQAEIASVEWNPDGGGDRLAIGEVVGLVTLYRGIQKPDQYLEGPYNIDSMVGSGEITDLSFGDIGEGDSGNDLAASTSTGFISVWDTLGDQGALAWKMQIDTGSVFSLDWNLENHQILTVSENEGIQVWNAANGGRLLQLKYPSRTAVWSPDGKYIAIEDHSTGKSAIVVFKSGAEQASLELPAAINKIAWSPDGKLIATAGKDGSIRLVSVLDIEDQIQSLEILSTYVQDSEVTDLTWSPDGDVILTGDVIGNIWAWQVR